MFDEQVEEAVEAVAGEEASQAPEEGAEDVPTEDVPAEGEEEQV